MLRSPIYQCHNPPPFLLLYTRQPCAYTNKFAKIMAPNKPCSVICKFSCWSVRTCLAMWLRHRQAASVSVLQQLESILSVISRWGVPAPPLAASWVCRWVWLLTDAPLGPVLCQTLAQLQSFLQLLERLLCVRCLQRCHSPLADLSCTADIQKCSHQRHCCQSLMRASAG